MGDEDIDRILPPLPATKIWGIGKATAAHLEKLGIRTIGDIRRKPLEWLQQHFGAEAQRYFDLASGIDNRPVVPDREAKSISHEQTFEFDVADREEVLRVLLDQVEQVARRLRKHGLQARGLALKIRYGDFETISRSTSLPGCTDGTAELWEAARRLFEKWAFRPVRLIGMAAERLTQGEEQMSLFTDAQRERQRKLDAVADRINEKFDNRTIRRGGGT